VPLSRFVSADIDEAFLTSTLRGVQPIARIGDRKVATVGGPETAKASDVYAALLADEIDP
jgi:branched-subunit amino acid aminotransferase/4-amino-4-deoxychorismate lyase